MEGQGACFCYAYRILVPYLIIYCIDEPCKCLLHIDVDVLVGRPHWMSAVITQEAYLGPTPARSRLTADGYEVCVCVCVLGRGELSGEGEAFLVPAGHPTLSRPY